MNKVVILSALFGGFPAATAYARSIIYANNSTARFNNGNSRANMNAVSAHDSYWSFFPTINRYLTYRPVYEVLRT